MKKFAQGLVALSFLALSFSAISARAPLDNIPSYNGTYLGTPGTTGYNGNVIFSTLYRDNYTGDPCTGEGCGSHLGVDISASKKTPVKAVVSGVVSNWSLTDSSWGSWLILTGANPLKPSEKVNYVYGHIQPTVLGGSFPIKGTAVVEGQQLGITDGTNCPSCTGPHLHFQVDKVGKTLSGLPIPRAPLEDLKVGTSTPDSSLVANSVTYNPLILVQSQDGYRWTFDGATTTNKAEFEFWNYPTNSTVSNGTLNLTDGAVGTYRQPGAPYVSSCSAVSPSGYNCSREINLDGSLFKKVSINMVCTPNTTQPLVKFSWMNKTNAWTSLSYVYTGSGTYTIDMSPYTSWTGTTVRGFMIQTPGCTAGTAKIGEVRIY